MMKWKLFVGGGVELWSVEIGCEEVMLNGIFEG